MSTDLERAVALREAGLTYDEIALRLGRGNGTIYRWLNPDFTERGRAGARRWKAENRDMVRAYARKRGAAQKVPCPNCGTLKEPVSEGCRGCQLTTHEVRWSLIEGMWAAGWSMPEMCSVLGSSMSALSVTMVRMRRDGLDLPHRYRVANGRRVSA